MATSPKKATAHHIVGATIVARAMVASPRGGYFPFSFFFEKSERW
jgi:hypothetical protein